MEIVEFGPLTPTYRAQLEGDEPDPFTAAGETLRFRPKDRHVALADEAGRLVASTGLVEIDAEVGGACLPVVGFGGVIVAAGHRGRGLARQVVGLALQRAAATGTAFAILFCREDRSGLYLKLGFARVADEVTVDQPGGRASMSRQWTMWRGLRPGAEWPAGPVTIHSLPF
jgi:predicted N-acetyltransferase YhbS